MPLTQARMLALIDAANAYREALLAVSPVLVNIAKNPSQAEPMLTGHRLTIADLDARHHRTLVIEDGHFASHGKRNAREAARQRAKREQARATPDYRGATIAHNKCHGPTLADHQRDVDEFLKQMEAEERAQAQAQAAIAPVDEAAILRRDGIEPMPIPASKSDPFARKQHKP